MKIFQIVVSCLVMIAAASAQTPTSGTSATALSTSSGVKPVSAAATGATTSGVPGLQVREIPVSLSEPGDAQAGAAVFEPTEGGLWLKDAPLNEVFQFLAGRASLQFFHNTNLNGPQYLVTGQLLDKFSPVKQMEEIGVMYGVNIHTKGDTVYALTAAQENVLPGKPVHYKLCYLRPTDIEKIKTILQPFLTPGTGIAEYEPKTNTIVIFDNERKATQLMELLKELDQPKEQVAIETRIIRVKSNSRNRVGVDWKTVLGDGISVDGVANLNSLFNLPDVSTITRTLTTVTSNQSYTGSNLVLSPSQMRAVVQALNEGGLAQQESSPTLVIEDNEEGIISIIDRVPIIVNTISETQVGQNISEDVRYKIDSEDANGDPTTTREIGVSVTLTPSILPDDTIRMQLRPRSAQVIEFIKSRSGNLFPRVNESTVSTMARIPNGHSLFIGGFYEEIKSDNSAKVPLLGDIPLFNFMFKNDDKTKEHTSLVFVVTPRLYRPCNLAENDFVSNEIKEIHVLPKNHDYPDGERPGFNHKRNLKNSWQGIFKKQAPEPPSNPLVPYCPQELAVPVAGNAAYPVSPYNHDVKPSVEVRPLSNTPAQTRNKLFQRSFSR